MKKHVLLLVGCVALATVVRGQNDPAAQPAPATPAPATQEAAPTNAAPAVTPTNAVPSNATPVVAEQAITAPATTALATNDSGAELVPLIVIDDVPLLDAVKNLARQAGLNYLPDPKLSTITNQPNVTLRLENVSAQDALTAVLETYNLQIVHDPRIKVSRITVKDPKAEDPLVPKVFQLKYTQPSNVVEIVKKTVGARGDVLPDLRTSQLFVLATEKQMPEVEKLIAKLDTPTRQVLIEAQSTLR